MLLLLLLLHPFIHSFIHLSPVETVALPDALPRPVSIFLCPTLEYLSVLSSSCLSVPTSCCLSSWCLISPLYHFCFDFLLLLRLHPPNSSSFGLIHRYLVLLSSCYFSLCSCSVLLILPFFSSITACPQLCTVFPPSTVHLSITFAKIKC